MAETTRLLPALAPLVRVGLSLIPAKRSAVALTLHDIPPTQMSWFSDVVDLIDARYGFVDPRGFSPSGPRASGVLLTFDDGFKSNRRVAEEILGPRGIKALFFVTEEFVGLKGGDAEGFAMRRFFPTRTSPPVSDGPLEALTWDDVSWLRSQGHEIGGHTASHPILSALPEPSQREEIVVSADRLADRIGGAVRHFAYPFGSLRAVDLRSVALARSRFECSFSNLRGHLAESPCKHFFFRQNLVPGMQRWMVEAVIEGRVDWKYRRLRRQAVERCRV